LARQPEAIVITSHKALADHLHEGVKIRKEDVLINFVEVPKENWSFGNGEAQYVTPPK